MNSSKDRKTNYKGSSDHLKKKFNIHKIVNFRLNVFIGICVILAAVLIFRMYKIQILDASHYEALYEKYQTPDDKYDTKRGGMFDRNNVSLVSSKGVNNIVYVKPKTGLKDSEQWQIAQNFAESFDLEFTLTERESKDAWLYLRKKKNDPSTHPITEEEMAQLKADKATDAEINAFERSKITDEMLADLSEFEKESFKVYLLMRTIESNNTAIIHKDASVEDIAFLAEHQSLLPGFSSQITWEREYNDDYGLNSIYGKIGPSSVEKSAFYNALNYGYNDAVGISGLEYQYESLLKGVKSVYTHDPVTKELQLVKEGSPGNDLRLSIDSELQAFLEEEIIKQLESDRNNNRRRFSKEMHAIITNPNNGDILAMAAMVRADDGTYYNDPQLTMIKSSPLGSVVKPATIYMGQNEGAIKPGQVFLDKEMYIKGTPVRRSYRNLGALDDIGAIQMSSNIYMFYTTIALAGSQYVPNGPLIFEDLDSLMGMMRNYYSRFGLGVVTGVDYPFEAVGYKGDNVNPGLALEFSIGQYDNYTAMQLSQYVNTLANRGYRLRPRLVLEAKDISTGRVVYENPVEILDTIDNPEILDRPLEGMRRCSAFGNCNGFTTPGISSAGKTGTAQLHSQGVAMKNHNFIAFAPFEEPEVAIACIHPDAFTDDVTDGLVNQCALLSKRIVENYLK